MLSNNFQPKKGVTTWTMLVTGRLIRFEVWTNRNVGTLPNYQGFFHRASGTSARNSWSLSSRKLKKK